MGDDLSLFILVQRDTKYHQINATVAVNNMQTSFETRPSIWGENDQILPENRQIIFLLHSSIPQRSDLSSNWIDILASPCRCARQFVKPLEWLHGIGQSNDGECGSVVDRWCDGTGRRPGIRRPRRSDPSLAYQSLSPIFLHTASRTQSKRQQLDSIINASAAAGAEFQRRVRQLSPTRSWILI